MHVIPAVEANSEPAELIEITEECYRLLQPGRKSKESEPDREFHRRALLVG